MKQSSYIQLPEAIRFIRAAEEAYRKFTPWNFFITLHLEAAGIAPKVASIHVRKSIQGLKRYHQRNGMDFSYGWVLENSAVKGVHLHLIVYRPQCILIHPMKYYWAILKRFKIKQTKGVLKSERFRRNQSYEENIMQVTSYCLKGLRPGTETVFRDKTGLELRTDLKSQGVIMGKRIGWSRE